MQAEITQIAKKKAHTDYRRTEIEKITGAKTTIINDFINKFLYTLILLMSFLLLIKSFLQFFVLCNHCKRVNNRLNESTEYLLISNQAMPRTRVLLISKAHHLGGLKTKNL